jgi:DNA-binding NarL/FixJ family response regulator
LSHIKRAAAVQDKTGVSPLDTNMSPIHLILVDDHAIVREGLARILQSEEPSWQVAEAKDAGAALALLRKDSVDVMVVDVAMPGLNGLELIQRAHALHPSLPCLVLSMHDEEQYATRAFRAGARGYLTKDKASAELIKAVRKVAAGGTYVTETLAERMVQSFTATEARPAHSRLSDREFEVLRHLASGMRVSDIAESLHISVKTVSTHKKHVLEKLNVGSVVELVRYGMDAGIISR